MMEIVVGILIGPVILRLVEIDARHAVGKIEEGLESLIAEGFVEPQPVKPLARLINGALPLRLRGVAVRRNLEAAARLLATVAKLVDRHASNLGDQCLDHAANLRVLGRHAGQRTTITADE